jgi:hypothetical protein
MAFQKFKKNLRLPTINRPSTADTKSMYTNINIDTNHDLEVLSLFLEELEREGTLPPDFNIEMIMRVGTVIMKWNLFKFINTCLN